MDPNMGYHNYRKSTNQNQKVLQANLNSYEGDTDHNTSYRLNNKPKIPMSYYFPEISNPVNSGININKYNKNGVSQMNPNANSNNSYSNSTEGMNENNFVNYPGGLGSMNMSNINNMSINIINQAPTRGSGYRQNNFNNEEDFINNFAVMNLKKEVSINNSTSPSKKEPAFNSYNYYFGYPGSEQESNTREYNHVSEVGHNGENSISGTSYYMDQSDQTQTQTNNSNNNTGLAYDDSNFQMNNLNYNNNNYNNYTNMNTPQFQNKSRKQFNNNNNREVNDSPYSKGQFNSVNSRSNNYNNNNNNTIYQNNNKFKEGNKKYHINNSNSHSSHNNHTSQNSNNYGNQNNQNHQNYQNYQNYQGHQTNRNKYNMGEQSSQQGHNRNNYNGSRMNSGMPMSICQPGMDSLKANTNNIPGRYFVLKSVDEDNIHKSIKYRIWCSTIKGNQKLHKAYKEADNKYPIYLFFSVNGSGRFLGLAQMTSEVEYRANFNFWTQNEKWKGFFFVVWLTIKDIPNRAFRQIINEYNEHKSVTASRDTQEIYPAAGAEMLKIFSEAPYETSILDDFKFYEKKQDHSKGTIGREDKNESRNLEENNEQNNEENNEENKEENKEEYLAMNNRKENERVDKIEGNFNETQLFNSNMNKGANLFNNQDQGHGQGQGQFKTQGQGFYMNQNNNTNTANRIFKRVKSTDVIIKTRKNDSEDENDN